MSVPKPTTDLDVLMAEVIVERDEQYGDATFGHANLGLMWTALLQNHYGIELDHPVPAELVMLMIACNKFNRAALGFDPDHYVDAMNYTRLAYQACLPRPEEETNADPS